MVLALGEKKRKKRSEKFSQDIYTRDKRWFPTDRCFPHNVPL